MNLSVIAIVLWMAGFVGHSALLAVLVTRQRVRVVPWFTAWVVFNIAYTLALFGAYRFGTKHTYFVFYWAGAFLDLLLQVSIVLEIAGHVLRRGGIWVVGARSRLVAAGVASALGGIGMAWLMTPASLTRLQGLEARVDLGATVIITFFFTAVMVTSQQLGLSWRSLVLREGYGIAAWSVISFVTDSLHAYWRTAEHFSVLQDVRIVVYLFALAYWGTIFWVPERLPLVPTDEQRRGIESLLKGLE